MNNIGFIGDTKKKHKNKSGSNVKGFLIMFLIVFIAGMVFLFLGYKLGITQDSDYYFQLKSQCDGKIVLAENNGSLGYRCTVK